MRLTKVQTEFGLNVFLEENNQYLAITFGGNGDLYWSIQNNPNENKFFTITKENYSIYSLFDKLYSDVETINIFGKFKKATQSLKNQLKNSHIYKEIFNQETKTITWYSDETACEVANVLKIVKEKESFRLEFNTQLYKEGYDTDFHSAKYIPIRFRNSGSHYYPFNIIFMRMYQNIQVIDDIHEIGHQIHLEEIHYSNQKNLVIEKLDCHK